MIQFSPKHFPLALGHGSKMKKMLVLLCTKLKPKLAEIACYIYGVKEGLSGRIRVEIISVLHPEREENSY